MFSKICNGIKIFCFQFIEVNKKPMSQGISDLSSVRSELLDCRVQDKELLEMSDQGKCMSMHQPWASLLVAGIKR